MPKPYLLQILQLKYKTRLSPVIKVFYLITLLILILLPTLKAQQKASYNILWRICGKGLTKPSYLFGTMHVKDSRAFRFSDSVMLAIQNCQAFALEVHPDTLIKKMFVTLHNEDSTRNVRKWLSDDQYAKLAKRFEEKNGYPMGNLDPMRIESMMKPEMKKLDDKKSFVDAYLFGVARAMGKNTYGLENASEQFDEHFGSKSDIKERLQDLIDDDNEQTALDEQEDMIKVYSTGNLENIVNYLGEGGLEANDIVARNKVMLNSMIKQMHDQSLFAAVGTAHLPGQNGLIALLKKAGYTVNPVAAAFTGIAGKFNTDYTKLPWKTYTDDESGYSLELPFTPMKTEVLYGMTTIIYPDIANDIYFGAYAIQKGSESKPVTEEDVIRKTISNFKANQKNHIISKNPVIVNGLKGTDIVMRTGTEVNRFRLLVSNNFLYCLYAGNNAESLNGEYANHFFNSFKSLKIAAKPDPAWTTFKNDTGAFSVHLPGPPKLLLKDIANPLKPKGELFRINVYMAPDNVNLENYLVRYSDYPITSYLANKEKAFESLIKEMGSRGKVIGEPRKISRNGYDGKEFDMLLSDKYNCTVQMIARGNRIYLLLKQNAAEGSSAKIKNDFFESFKFVPYLKTELKPFKIDDGAFTSSVFPHTISEKDSVRDYDSFLYGVSNTYSKNDVSGGSYSLEHATISKYYRVKNIDSLYNLFADRFNKYPDSLIKTDTIVINGLKGRQFISQRIGTNDKKRSTLFIDNADLFYFSGHVANEELFNENNNEFYTSLTKTHSTPGIDLGSSKAKLITEDLSSTDTAIYKSALGALSYYNFEKDELPYVYNALDRKYTDDTTRKGARYSLLKVLSKVNDEKTLGRLKSLYNEKSTTDILKVELLGTFTKVNKKEGYDVYLDLLTTSPELKSDELYRAFSPMHDSIEYVAANYKRILPLLKYTEYRKKLLPVISQMTYSKNKQTYAQLLKNSFGEIMTYAMTDVNDYVSKKDTTNDRWFSSGFSYLQLMQAVKGQPVTEGFTAKLIKTGRKEYQLVEAVSTRIANHLIVDQKLLNTLLDSMEVRYNLMEALNKEKQLARVPPKYKKQVEFAKLCLYQSMTADDEEISKNITLLGSLADKGNNYYVFKYKQEYDDDHNIYLGICGPYRPEAIKLKFGDSYHAYYDGTVKKLNWQSQAKKMLIKLKEQNKTDLAKTAD